MARKPKKGDVVAVEWIDSAMLDGVWHTPDAMREHSCETCYSVGFLGRYDKADLVLCSSITAHQVARVHAIPSACVKSIEILVKRKKPK